MAKKGMLSGVGRLRLEPLCSVVYSVNIGMVSRPH